MLLKMFIVRWYIVQDTIVVAILSLIGTLAGSFGGTQLIKYRIEQLEKKV